MATVLEWNGRYDDDCDNYGGGGGNMYNEGCISDSSDKSGNVNGSGNDGSEDGEREDNYEDDYDNYSGDKMTMMMAMIMMIIGRTRIGWWWWWWRWKSRGRWKCDDCGQNLLNNRYMWGTW